MIHSYGNRLAQSKLSYTPQNTAGRFVADLASLYTASASGRPKVSGGEIVQTLAECVRRNWERLDITLGDASNLSPWYVWKEGRGFYMRYGFQEELGGSVAHLIEKWSLCGRPSISPPGVLDRARSTGGPGFGPMDPNQMNFRQLWDIVQDSRQLSLSTGDFFRSYPREGDDRWEWRRPGALESSRTNWVKWLDRNPAFEATLHAVVDGVEAARTRVDRLARSGDNGFLELLRQLRVYDTRLHRLLRRWPQAQ